MSVLPIANVLAAFGPGVAIMPWRRVNAGLSLEPVFAVGDPPEYSLKRDVRHIAFRQFLASRLAIAPKVITASATPCEWSLSTWMPGASVQTLNDSQTDNVAHALSRIHAIARECAPVVADRDALRQRLEFINTMLPGGERLPIPYDLPVEAQLIHGDLHREHLLFEGDRVSGFIDWSNVKLDHPAIDVARYFGEFPGCVPFAVNAYHVAGGMRSVTVPLVELLVQAIARAAVHHWQTRLAAGSVPVEKIPVATRRLEQFAARLRAL